VSPRGESASVRDARRPGRTTGLRHPRVEGVVAACLLAAAWPGADRSTPDCPSPSLLPAGEGRAPEVSCTGEGEALTGALPLLFGRGLDPAVADAAALEHLPGIGPVRSAALVAARAERALCRVQDLTHVHGIGARTLERLRPYLTFGGDPRCGSGSPGPSNGLAERGAG
jgi:competence protein ComEA